MKYLEKKLVHRKSESKRCRKSSIRWNVLLVIFATMHVASAQEPTMSPAPSPTSAIVDDESSMPSPVPETSSPTDSLQPTVEPSANPTASPQPSVSPTISFQPTVSEMPSSSPTITPMPTLTKVPTNAPSTSPLPTTVTSSSPSGSPTKSPEVFSAELFNNRMVFDGLPFIINKTFVNNTNTTGNITWTNITSQHVISYWRQRIPPYTGFNITSVVTNFVNQFPEPADDANPAIPNVQRTRVIYDQQIRFFVTGPNSPVQSDQNASVLFLWPFRANSQPYVDELWKAFAPVPRIHLLDVSLQRQPPGMTPTMAPNGVTPTDVPDDAMDTSTIVAIVLGIVSAVGLVFFIGIWYITRRKPDIVIEDEFAGGDDSDIVMVAPPNEDPRVFVPGQQQQGAMYYGQVPPPETNVSTGEKQDSASFSKEEEDGDAPDSNRDGSLHVGIPVEEDLDSDSMEDDYDDDDYYYPQQELHRESVIEANRPSLTAFGLQISELEE